MEGGSAGLKKNRRLWFLLAFACLLIGMMVVTPFTAQADEKKDQRIPVDDPFGHDLLPKESPVKKEEGTPLYDKYDISSYSLDTDTSEGLIPVVPDIVDKITDMMMIFNGYFNRVVIWFAQNTFGGEMVDDVSDDVATWVENLFHLFLDKFLVTGLLVLGLWCVISFVRTGGIGDQLLRSFALLAGFILLCSSMSTIFTWTGHLERSGTDLVFLGYSKVINNEEISGNGDDQQTALEKSRSKALVKMGETYWKTFQYYPWQLMEFGRVAIPNKDGEYSKLGKQIRKDTDLILSLNPLDPKDYVKRGTYVQEWTPGGNIFVDFYNKIVPDDYKMEDQPIYTSMTVGAVWMRFVIALITLFGSICYGLLLLSLSLLGIVAEIIVYLLVLTLPILMFVSFIPAWGEEVFKTWGKGFVLASFYKVILSALVMAALGLTNLLSFGSQLFGKYGLIITFIVQIAVFLAVVFYNQWVITMLLSAGGRFMGALQKKTDNAVNKVKDLGVGGALAAAGFGLAAATGNPAFLKSGAKLFNAFRRSDRKNTGAAEQGGTLKPGAEKQGYVPPDFSQQAGGVIEMNPYEPESNEAQLFDDMKRLGYNPYSSKDQADYSKKYIADKGFRKENGVGVKGPGTGPNYRTQETMNTLKNHTQAFAHRAKKNDRARKRANLMNELNQIEARAIERAKEKRKAKSIFNRWQSKMWGEK